MTKIQINLSNEENKIVGIHKIVKDLKTKAEAIKDIILNFKEVKNGKAKNN